MHELPVTQGLLATALRAAEAQNATRITDLHLLIGQLSSIIDDSVQFYWDIISRGTVAEGATLHFQRVTMTLFCFDCGQTCQPTPGTLCCSRCGGHQVEVVGGDELRLEAINIEQAEDE